MENISNWREFNYIQGLQMILNVCKFKEILVVKCLEL